MNPAVSAAWITGGASTVNSAGNVISQLLANHQNEKLAEKQNQWNLQQWQRENEYNLPANQVARLKEAGINPDLYYGQNGLMNESASSPTMERSTMYPAQAGFELGSAVQAYQNSKMVDAQVDLMNADVQLKKQELDNRRQDIVESQARVRESMQRIAESLDRCREIQANINKMSAETRKTMRDKWHIDFVEMMDSKRYNNEVRDLESIISNRNFQNKLNVSITNLNKRSLYEAIETFPERLSGLHWETENKHQMYLNALVDNAFLNTTLKYRQLQEKYKASLLMNQNRREHQLYKKAFYNNERFKYELDYFYRNKSNRVRLFESELLNKSTRNWLQIYNSTIAD